MRRSGQGCATSFANPRPAAFAAMFQRCTVRNRTRPRIDAPPASPRIRVPAPPRPRAAASPRIALTHLAEFVARARKRGPLPTPSERRVASIRASKRPRMGFDRRYYTCPDQPSVAASAKVDGSSDGIGPPQVFSTRLETFVGAVKYITVIVHFEGISRRAKRSASGQSGGEGQGRSGPAPRVLGEGSRRLNRQGWGAPRAAAGLRTLRGGADRRFAPV